MDKMKLEKAIKILELHNKWRRDNDGKYIMADPEELGISIDTVVREFKKRKIDKHKLKEAFKTYMNYDIISDERFKDPFDSEVQKRVNKDADKLVNLVIDIIEK